MTVAPGTDAASGAVVTATEGQTLRQLGPTVYLPSAVYSTGLGAALSAYLLHRWIPPHHLPRPTL